MIVDSFDLKFKERLRLRGISDVHIGAAAQEEKRLKKDLQTVLEEDDSYVILLGDQIEAITLKDPRFKTTSVKSTMRDFLDNLLDVQVEEAVELFRPLAEEGKIIGALLGNHELKAGDHSGTDVHKRFCDALGIIDLGYSCFLRLNLIKETENSVRQRNIDYYAHHGHGGTGKKSGASINSMEDLVADWDADIYMMGHNHKRHTSKTTSFYMTSRGKPRLVEKDRVFIRTGSYYKTYREGSRPDYGEVKGYRPAHIGSPPYVDITFEGKHSDVRMMVTE